MTVQLETWHVVSLLALLIGAFWALVKLMLTQERVHQATRFDDMGRRFDGLELVHREEASQWARMERELLQLKADLPLNYVRREDYIRGQSVLEAKLDGLAVRLENAQLRLGGHHGS